MTHPMTHPMNHPAQRPGARPGSPSTIGSLWHPSLRALRWACPGLVSVGTELYLVGGADYDSQHFYARASVDIARPLLKHSPNGECYSALVHTRHHSNRSTRLR